MQNVNNKQINKTEQPTKDSIYKQLNHEKVSMSMETKITCSQRKFSRSVFFVLSTNKYFSN